MLENTVEPTLLVVGVNDKATSSSLGKKTTRHWDAWTHEEESSFFFALRHVGKNFDEITRRVQSKNKDQVRHYYYRLIRRINRLLGPGFILDAKNVKDANSAMLHWWSLMEKQSCSASKLHLKPRCFKNFVTALESQLTKDRKKASRKRASASVDGTVEEVIVDTPRPPRDIASRKSLGIQCVDLVKRRTRREKPSSMGELLQPSRHHKKFSVAQKKRWEKAATEGVNLVAEAAEQLERAAAALGQLAPVENLACDSKTSTVQCIAGELRFPAVSTENMKLKLQLFPIDDATRKCLEEVGHNPYLELTLKPRKSISSIIRHLTHKWGSISTVKGELQLFAYDTQTSGVVPCRKWASNDTSITAGDMYAALGNPVVFRMRYGWITSCMLENSEAELLDVPSDEAQVEMPASTCAGFKTQGSDMEKEPAYVDAKIAVSNIAACSPVEMNLLDHPQAEHKEQETGTSTGSCLWFFEGSNDGFALHSWVSEEPTYTKLPTEIDWVDSLTNISVGELLNEVSQAGKMMSESAMVPSHENVQALQSLDSFDATVAAQHQCHEHPSPSPSYVAGTSNMCWDDDDTRDAFAFRKLVAQRDQGSSNSVAREAMAKHTSDGLPLACMADYGSLEAWKQSFGHIDLSLPEELKGESGSLVTKRYHSQDFSWVS